MVFPWCSHDLPPFSHSFPMVFYGLPWFSHGFPMVFPWFSHSFLGFPMVFSGISMFSHGFPMESHPPSRIIPALRTTDEASKVRALTRWLGPEKAMDLLSAWASPGENWETHGENHGKMVSSPGVQW